MPSRSPTEALRTAGRRAREAEAEVGRQKAEIAKLTKELAAAAKSRDKAQSENEVLRAAQETRTAAVEKMGPHAGQWGRELDILREFMAHTLLGAVLDDEAVHAGAAS